jgi:septal ring factor EnvC (AmiA/AmiB activator)
LRKANAAVCIVISLCILAVSGCARKTTTADLMKGHAVEMQSQVDLKNQLAKEWERGQKLILSGEKRVNAGEKRVKSAERDLKRGQDDIERGRREIAEGQKLTEQSENRFRENFPDLEIK